MINNNQNKELLWNLLYENKIFNNIPNNNIDSVKRIFESTINEYSHITINNNNDLININKVIISNLITKINTLKNNIFEPKKVKNEYVSEKMSNISENVALHKKTMDTLLNPEKPQEIDFNDNLNVDQPLNTNEMNSILERMQNERSLSDNIFDNNNIGNNNINMDSNNNSNSNSNSNSIAPKLKISNIEDLFDSNIPVINIKETKNNVISQDTKIIENIENIEITNSDNDDKVESVYENNFMTPRVKSFINNEYDSEYKTNLNIKLDTILSILSKIQEDQKKIKDSLIKN